ncbi:HAD-IA family hydrolase [candidate division KSB1 bacterium]|nr:HAD-IA family hydrolase [candidate division KSB1 bacterium]
MKSGFIFDVDGVLVDTPHEQAWRESFQNLFETKPHWKKLLQNANYAPEKFSTDLYRTQISGKTRYEGAQAVLDYFSVPDPDGTLLDEYCRAKQQLVLTKIETGDFKVFDDALLFLMNAKARGAKLVAASSSKNATPLLEKINILRFAETNKLDFPFLNRSTTLLSLFDGNVCGIDLEKGKPEPEIFMKAAESIRLSPAQCLVVEDAVSGVQAAINGGFFCIGIARLNDEKELRDAGAHIVTDDLRTVFSSVFECRWNQYLERN